MSKNCCCGSAGQIDCNDWCNCLPQRATLQGLTISINVKTYCNGAIAEERDIGLNLTQVKLVNSGLCYMVSDAQSGTWSFSDRTRQYSTPPDGIINRAGCPNVNCIYECNHRELCRTYLTSASGINPGASIHCDNPCQFPILDAFSRLDWFVDGDVFTDTDTGSNAYPDLNAHLACRFPSPPNNPAFQHGPCSSYFNTTVGPYYNARGGSIFGRRGCLTNQSFTRFNACNSIGKLIDPNTDPPAIGAGSCTNPLELPNCYVCSGGTMVPNEQISSVDYIMQTCSVNACCGSHDCYNYNGGVVPVNELFCCGPSNCNSCQNYNANNFGPQYSVTTFSTQLTVTVP